MTVVSYTIIKYGSRVGGTRLEAAGTKSWGSGRRIRTNPVVYDEAERPNRLLTSDVRRPLRLATVSHRTKSLLHARLASETWRELGRKPYSYPTRSARSCASDVRPRRFSRCDRFPIRRVRLITMKRTIILCTRPYPQTVVVSRLKHL